MGLLGEILTWSLTQPAWQRDALRRLFQRDTLSADDFDQLYEILKAKVDGRMGDVVVQPLEERDLPSGLDAEKVKLLGMSNMKNVNGFPDGRAITFNRDGITLVYGHNGAGKSGYARVLKNACRARKVEPVKPNVFRKDGVKGVPEAVFNVEINGEEKDIKWTQSGGALRPLSNVHVYDAHCANCYLTEEGALTFQPYGLGQLNALVNACATLDKRLRVELDQLRMDKTQFLALQGETEVGRLIAKIGAKTDLDKLKALSCFTESETKRYEVLNRLLKEQDPIQKAKSCEGTATRLVAIAQRASQASAYVTDKAIAKLKQMNETWRIARDGLELARKELSKNSLLEGTGSPLWRALFDAAAKFSIQEAYVGHDHPHLADGAVCVLCQNPLNQVSKDRLAKFNEFVLSTITADADKASSELVEAKTKIQNADFSLGIDEALSKDLADLCPELHLLINGWREAWQARRQWMIEAVSSNAWEAPPPQLAGEPLATLIESDIRRLREHAASLRGTVDPEAKRRLDLEREEFKSRSQLRVLLENVVSYVEVAKKREQLENLAADLRGGGISRQLTALSEKYVTAVLAIAMNNELLKLGFTKKVNYVLPRRTDKGVVLVAVKMQDSSESPAAVLSEGEQKMTALAFFLAEVELASDKSAFVFDDPVTSLDHRYRRSVANRLAELGKARQVIVFTHDAVFLSSIYSAIISNDVPRDYRRVEWDSAPGRVFNEFGWDQKSFGARLDELQARVSQLEQRVGEYPNEADRASMAEIYSMIRGSIERLTRDELINGVLQPYDDEVKIEAYAGVIGLITDAEWDGVLEIYDRACEATRAHDTTSEQQIELPSIMVSRGDLTYLRELAAKLKIRRSDGNKKRELRRVARQSSPISPKKA